MTEEEIEKLEKAAELRQREAEAKKKIADWREQGAQASIRGNWAPQMASYRAEQERFREYRENATQERMDRINRHPENYFSFERKAAADYAKEQEAKHQFNANDATRRQESTDKRDAMVDQGRGAIFERRMAERDDFERKFGDGEKYRAEQEAARRAEIEKARVAGADAAAENAKAHAETVRMNNESRERIGTEKNAAATRVAEIRAQASKDETAWEIEAKKAEEMNRREAKDAKDLERRRGQMVQQWLQNGLRPEKIKQMGLKLGWTEEEVDKSLGVKPGGGKTGTGFGNIG